MVAGPMSATDALVDALYAEPFPTHEALEHFVLHELTTPDLPTLMWNAELGEINHAHLQRIFDSRMDPTVVKEVGEAINERGGFQAMQANFYIYCHLIGERLKDHVKYLGVPCDIFYDTFHDHAKEIEFLWHEIGEWRA